MSQNAEHTELMSDGLDRIAEVARFLRTSVGTVYALMGRGELPFVKIGKLRRIPHHAVLELAARNLVAQRAGPAEPSAERKEP
jgi:excisionase family DNA binding protein